MKADEIPANSRLLASDDVFDAMLDTRAFNDGMDQEREAVFQEYLANQAPAIFSFHPWRITSSFVLSTMRGIKRSRATYGRSWA